MEGYLSKERKDWWKITESGIQQLSALLEELKISEHPLIAESAIKDAEIKNIEILLPAAVSHIRSSVDKLQITKTEREAIIQQRIVKESSENDCLPDPIPVRCADWKTKAF